MIVMSIGMVRSVTCFDRSITDSESRRSSRLLSLEFGLSYAN